MTPVEGGLALILVAALMCRRRPRPASVVVMRNGAGALALLGLVALAAVEIALHEHPAAAKPAVVTRTVVQHVPPSHPVLAGWPLVTVIVAALVVALVIMLNTRSGD